MRHAWLPAVTDGDETVWRCSCGDEVFRGPAFGARTTDADIRARSDAVMAAFAAHNPPTPPPEPT